MCFLAYLSFVFLLVIACSVTLTFSSHHITSHIQRKKQKLGKKKPLPDNETPTSFKTKVIRVPEQSIVVKGAASHRTVAKEESATTTTTAAAAGGEQSSASVSTRGLSLEDLLARVGHTNERVRQDALLGIRDIKVPRSQLGTVLERLAQVATTAEDRSTRHNARSAMNSVLLGCDNDAEAVAPFMDLIAAYVTAGLAHEDENLRADNLELATNILLERCPALVIGKFSRQMLDNICPMIAASSFNTLQDQVHSMSSRPLPSAKPSEAGGLSNKSKYIVAKAQTYKLRIAALLSLVRFLKLEFSSSALPEAKKASKPSFDYLRTMPSPAAFATKKFVSGISSADCVAMIESVHKGLIEMWIDCTANQGPISVVASTGVPLHQVLKSILEALCLLWDNIQRESVSKEKMKQWIDDYKKYMLQGCFPLQCPKNPEEKEETLLSEVNALICLLFSHFLTAIAPCQKECTCWASSIATFLLASFHGYLHPNEDQMAALHAGTLESCSLPAHLISLVFRQLPILAELIAHSKSNRDLLMPAFLRFYETCDPASSSRLSCLSFISHTLFDASHKMIWNEEDTAKVISLLPKLLWQLKCNNIQTTDSAITLLLENAKRVREPSKMDQLQESLVPFFFVVVPAKQGKPAKSVFGPFLNLPSELQVKVVHLIRYFSSLAPLMERAMIACLFDHRMTATVSIHIIELIEYFHVELPKCLSASFAAFVSSAIAKATSLLSRNECVPLVLTVTQQLCDCITRNVRAAEHDENFFQMCSSILPVALQGPSNSSKGLAPMPLLQFFNASQRSQSSSAHTLSPEFTESLASAVSSVALNGQEGLSNAQGLACEAEKACLSSPAVLRSSISLLISQMKKNDPATFPAQCSALVVILSQFKLLRPLVVKAEIRDLFFTSSSDDGLMSLLKQSTTAAASELLQTLTLLYGSS